MTGKELKEFAAKVSDESIVEVRERHYGDFTGKFQLKASVLSSRSNETNDVMEAPNV